MSNNAGDTSIEGGGTVYRILAAGFYFLVQLESTIVCLQEFAVENGAELDLEGELAVIN